MLAFAQSYKHIYRAPDDVIDPDAKDPNPIAQGKVSISSARIASSLLLLLALVAAWKLGTGNLIVILVMLIISISLYHPNICLSSCPILGLNDRHWILGSLMTINGLMTTQNQFFTLEKLSPVIFILSFYFLFKSFELKHLEKNSSLSTIIKFLVGIFLTLSGLFTFLVLKPFPVWTLALLVLLIAVRLAFRNIQAPKENSALRYSIFYYFESSAAIAFLVYFIILSINFS